MMEKAAAGKGCGFFVRGRIGLGLFNCPKYICNADETGCCIADEQSFFEVKFKRVTAERIDFFPLAAAKLCKRKC